ncbi:MAG: lytic murein transglycosylase B [Methylovulum sp.]|uniref:lytic murein transglycosylase B n=1 Tax=Methylovulum sp. TaxID=1916980 RepID=UPI0026063174|nr:lytic murein transglycosylase B [Methylovulum sp.]MDD2724669.1 lytic murein transglycosylase B [Methylovulum sp.]MDD5123496.1 lytic murein transglycosylase B [Methylovulum sp.]
MKTSIPVALQQLDFALSRPFSFKKPGRHKPQNIYIGLLIFTLCLTACASLPNPDGIKNAFIAKMVTVHQFDETELRALFANAVIKDDILKKIAKPAEGLPWFQYRKIFITDARVDAGVKFWQDHAQTLSEAERRYGVPAQIIVAILGVETFYGQHPGKYRVIDALSTLAFAYPPRSEFFLSELEQFLLLCREEHIKPLDPIGSYAGAMGKPQFMPSSFRRYATDFNKDNRRDIWQDNADVIASVANYFRQFHWQTGQAIATPVTSTGEQYKSILNANLKPDLRLARLESLNLKISQPLALVDKVKILELKQEQGEELWAVTDNFYCLTRYNHSALYAMAVFQLSESILIRGQSYGQTHNSRIFYDGMQFFEQPNFKR